MSRSSKCPVVTNSDTPASPSTADVTMTAAATGLLANGWLRKRSTSPATTSTNAGRTSAGRRNGRSQKRVIVW